MRTRLLIGIGLIVLGTASNIRSQEVNWRPAKAASSTTPLKLGLPAPINDGQVILTAGADSRPTSPSPIVARGQIGEPPPPPPFPSGGPVFPPQGNTQMYNQGVVNSDADLGFWSHLGDKMKRCWDDVSGGVGGAFQGGSKRQMFQSDHDFDTFSSPVTNPFFFEDPRALTEIRPVFIWQRTPSSNPIFNGGNNFVFSATGSVAFTEHISLTLNRLGFTSDHPRTATGDIVSATGFSEILLGPKITFLRNCETGTVAAFGLIFDIPGGSGNVQQNTGHLMLDPYFSIAQNFGRSSYGSFNFMNTTGYTFRTDNTRTEALYSSFHLDYEIAKRFYPMIEANWRHYTRNGGARPLNFEGSDLTNYGAQTISGQNELTLALGGRLKINTFMWWGLAAEFNVLSNGDGRHLDQFRLTTDLIFRY